MKRIEGRKQPGEFKISQETDRLTNVVCLLRIRAVSNDGRDRVKVKKIIVKK